MGCTFKEDVSDIRNSKVFDLVDGLVSLGADVDVIDPNACIDMVEYEYDLKMVANMTDLLPNSYDVVVLAVPHRQYIHYGWHIVNRFLSKDVVSIVLDLKAKLDRESTPAGVILIRP
jgi:UDP-N-acetyl-D-galactosamine dehydrogenase